jgi:hypothetical protein
MTRTKTKDRPDTLLFGDAEIELPPKSEGDAPGPSPLAVKATPSASESGRGQPSPAKKPTKNAVAKVERLPAPMNVLDALAAALKNPDVDPVKMRELYKLYQETEAKQQFHDALLAIDFPSINRDGKIPVKGGRDLRFASFENVHKAVMPLLRQHRFRMSFAPMPGENGTGLVVECRLIRGTYEEKCVVPISTAPASRAMNSQQAIGAAIKYASRYGVMYLLNLRSEAPEDRDTDGVHPQEVAEQEAANATINGSQAKKLLEAINDSGIEATRFMEKYGIKAVHELPTKLFDEAMKALRDYGARRAAQEKNAQ